MTNSIPSYFMYNDDAQTDRKEVDFFHCKLNYFINLLTKKL